MEDSQLIESKMADMEIADSDHVVLVAVDTSNHSDYAMKYYLSQLYRPNHFVIFHHTFEPPHVACGIGAAGVGQVSSLNAEQWEEMFTQQTESVTKLKEDIKAMMAHSYKEVRHRFQFEGHLGNKPGEGIVKAAEDQHVDLIVMGTRGKGTIRRTILGSVSHYVLHHVQCPLTICHLPKEKHHKHHKHHDEHDKHHHKHEKKHEH